MNDLGSASPRGPPCPTRARPSSAARPGTNGSEILVPRSAWTRTAWALTTTMNTECPMKKNTRPKYLDCCPARPDHLYHYTTGVRLQAILADGAIRPATACIDPGEMPVVWFTRSEVWEPTANKMIGTPFGVMPGTREMTERIGRGLYRIRIPGAVAPVHWRRWVRTSGVRLLTAEVLAHGARAQGSDPNDWWVSPMPVPEQDWLGIEVWRDDQWVAADLGAVQRVA